MTPHVPIYGRWAVKRYFLYLNRTLMNGDSIIPNSPSMASELMNLIRVLDAPRNTQSGSSPYSDRHAGGEYRIKGDDDAHVVSNVGSRKVW